MTTIVRPALGAAAGGIVRPALGAAAGGIVRPALGAAAGGIVRPALGAAAGGLAGASHTLFFDGGSNPNPGPSGAGAVLLSPGGATEWEGSIFVGVRATNNEAEYHGLIIGLEKACALRVQRLTVVGDSELVIRQMLGTYKVKAQNLIPLHRRALAAARTLPWCRFEHTRRENNRRADALATAGIALGAHGAQQPTPAPVPVPVAVLPAPGGKRTAEGAGLASGPATPRQRGGARPQSSLLAADAASAAPGGTLTPRSASASRGRTLVLPLAADVIDLISDSD